MEKTKFILHYGGKFNRHSRSFETLVEARDFLNTHFFSDPLTTYLEKTERVVDVQIPFKNLNEIKDPKTKAQFSSVGIISKNELLRTNEAASIEMTPNATFIDGVLNSVYPIEESNTDDAVSALGRELDRIYHKGGSWTINGFKPTMAEVGMLYDVYKNIVHDHAPLSSITTISQTVSDILKSLGFNVNTKGIGWCLAEGEEYV